MSSLEHYGVKGMKWGVRKKRDTTSRSSRPKVPNSSDYTRSREIHKKGRYATSRLSNQEFKEMLERMDLEQRYSQIQVKRRKASPAYQVFDMFVKPMLKDQANSFIREGAKKYGPELTRMMIEQLRS